MQLNLNNIHDQSVRILINNHNSAGYYNQYRITKTDLDARFPTVLAYKGSTPVTLQNDSNQIVLDGQLG